MVYLLGLRLGTVLRRLDGFAALQHELSIGFSHPIASDICCDAAI
jgi:hypothetical protein